MSIEEYTFEDKDGRESLFTTQDADEARKYAAEHKLKWIANVYVFADSELVYDYTEPEEPTEPAPGDSDAWYCEDCGELIDSATRGCETTDCPSFGRNPRPA